MLWTKYCLLHMQGRFFFPMMEHRLVRDDARWRAFPVRWTLIVEREISSNQNPRRWVGMFWLPTRYHKSAAVIEKISKSIFVALMDLFLSFWVTEYNLFEPNIPTNLSETNLSEANIFFWTEHLKTNHFEFSLNYFLLNCLFNLV